MVKLTIDSKQADLGTFDTRGEAANACDQAIVKHNLSTKKLNFLHNNKTKIMYATQNNRKKLNLKKYINFRVPAFVINII